MSEIKVKRYEDLSEIEKLSITDFSYSRIDTYLSCAAKYFYSYVQKEPRQFGAAAVLGNIVHATLENCVDDTKPLDFRELKQDYLKNIPEWDPDELIPRELIDVGHTILDEFYDQHLDKVFDVYAKEMPFRFIIGSYAINGFIDRVDVVGNRVHITDYKTGKWEVSAKEAPNNLQLGIYALAASIEFLITKSTRSYTIFDLVERKGHLFTPEDIENVKERIIGLANQIVHEQNFLPTDQFRICSYCDHAKNGACGIGSYRNRNRINR